MARQGQNTQRNRFHIKADPLRGAMIRLAATKTARSGPNFCLHAAAEAAAKVLTPGEMQELRRLYGDALPAATD